MKKKYLYTLFIIFLSCNSYKQVLKNDDYKILNIVLAKENIRIKERAYLEQSIISFFQIYEKQYLANKRVKKKVNTNIEWIFNENDITFLSKEYTQWERRIWKKISDKQLGINTITYPFYNRNKTKAMVLVSKSRASIKIVLLKKENTHWTIVGELLKK